MVRAWGHGADLRGRLRRARALGRGWALPKSSHRRALLSPPRRHARPRPARRPRSRCKSSIHMLPQALSAGGGLKHPPAPPSGMGWACGAHQAAATRLVSGGAEATVTPRRAVPAARTAHRAHVSRGRTYPPTTCMRGEPHAQHRIRTAVIAMGQCTHGQAISRKHVFAGRDAPAARQRQWTVLRLGRGALAALRTHGGGTPAVVPRCAR